MSLFKGLKNFVLIWFGQVVSAVGSRLSAFALGIWVYQTTGSATQFALIFVSMAIPALIVSPLAGALVDRWDRRITMMCCDILSATTMLSLAALLASDNLEIWHIYAGVGLSSIGNAFHQPAYASSIPLLVTSKQLPRVNGMVQLSFAIAMVVAPLLAGILVTTISLYGVLIIDAVTFLAGLCAISFARIPRPKKSPDAQQESLLSETIFGWKFVSGRSDLVGLLTIFGFNNFLFGIASIAITPLVLSFSNAAMLGVQFSIGGAGLLLGGLLMTLTGGTKKKIHGVIIFSFLGGLAMAAHGLAPSFTLVAIVGFILFLMLPIIGASNDSIWQSKVPTAVQGRCFAIQRMLSETVMSIGYALAGPMMEFVFEPLLNPQGALTESVGLVIGVGEGRGTGLMFIVLGLLMSTVAVIAYSFPALRQVDSLPDLLDRDSADVSEEIDSSLGVAVTNEEIDHKKTKLGLQSNTEIQAENC